MQVWMILYIYMSLKFLYIQPCAVSAVFCDEAYYQLADKVRLNQNL